MFVDTGAFVAKEIANDQQREREGRTVVGEVFRFLFGQVRRISPLQGEVAEMVWEPVSPGPAVVVTTPRPGAGVEAPGSRAGVGRAVGRFVEFGGAVAGGGGPACVNTVEQP